ncbi:DUF6421 family protein [Paraburkholderia bryophila]|uniref:DUF6421 family protein n=1 Tax=Paraburkholderia bryophila TaxID=420952 RepID=UPI0023495AB1|nr:DUF6421 family protein [Paraburkholderia bryophila]WCM22540.1 DUF6421 family protein [Paraburkholderia bryophila]
MKPEIVQAVNRCRHEILSGGFRSDVARIERCAKAHLGDYADNPHVRALLVTLENRGLASGRLLDLTYSVDPRFILGFFDVPYNTEAFLEAAAVAPVPIPQSVLSIAPDGNALPVRVMTCTDGFRNPLAVAVFGENFIQADLQVYHKAYYFIDKFVERFRNHTRPAIETMWSPTAFPDIVTAGDDLLMQASAIWVHMHEHHHRVGFLPIPQHLHAKSTRNGAGAEELRVDILSILALSRLESSDPVLRASIQYILAERLIRYPLQAPPQDNYDARSSVALFHYLWRHGAIASRCGKLYFEGGYERLIRALRSIAIKLTAIEYRLSVSPELDRKQILACVLPGLAKNDNNWSAAPAPMQSPPH